MNGLDAEAARVRELHEYGLLDTPAGPELEAVLRTAAYVAGTPTATLNLIDTHRQCQLTTVGFEGGDSPRDESMCATSITIGGFVHIPDAAQDPRFSGNPWVDGRIGKIRFYAAAPLVTPLGHALGTLCVFDSVPGRLGPEQIDRLTDLAQVVLGLFERRRQARVQQELAEQAERARLEVAVAHRELEHRQRQLQAAHQQVVDRTDELERSNTELQRFAAVASHDLRAPLAVVNGYLQQLEETYDVQFDARAKKWIATAIAGTGRMTALIDALLAYAQAGATYVVADDTDLQEIFDLAVTDLRTAVTATGAEVRADGRLPVVRGDAVLLRQLLQNLIANAIKFRHPDRPARVTCSAEHAEGTWTVSVADTGVGIPAERRASAFGMFERLDASRATPGHGIGLATCQRIVERHGGRIWIDETPGGGATVRFTLPEL
ncbi:GAF domain-containing sensor histidine kinase [Planobispora takensis]|uniref:Sensor-like histidine kinase SenX3 n=1 Tax=Planobispora takensis TaxID=1367882 RepID=A0A8J3T3W4_9ACTN|nr:ATP-binding protein [Planobispora takensis]GII05864.1 hypothetical protein Pta02_78720 [Planobispora takensis]